MLADNPFPTRLIEGYPLSTHREEKGLCSPLELPHLRQTSFLEEPEKLLGEGLQVDHVAGGVLEMLFGEIPSPDLTPLILLFGLTLSCCDFSSLQAVPSHEVCFRYPER